MALFSDFTSGQSNVSYTRMRQLFAVSGGGLQEGVAGAGDFKVAQRAAGANPSVDVAVGDAWVQYDTGARNGLSHVWSDAVANVPISPSDLTNPRVDQIGVQLNDTAVGAGTGGNTPTLRYVQGTATAGATLDNRNGAAATPADWMRLADFVVPAGTNSPVTTANIRDRRPWARGAYWRVSRSAGDLTVTSVTPTYTTLDPTVFTPRIECSGVPMVIRLHASSFFSVAGTNYLFRAVLDGGTTALDVLHRAMSAAGGEISGPLEWLVAPAAGSHVFNVQAAAPSAGTVTIESNTTTPLWMEVAEIVRPNASNT